MVCQGLDIFGPTVNFIQLLSYPSTCDFQFYAKIFAGLFIIIAINLYMLDRERLPKADFISSMGVSAIATIGLALAGSIAGFVEQTIFIEILVGGLVVIAIWMFKK